MKKKYIILGLSLLLITIVSTTFAWISNYRNEKEIIIKIGNLQYEKRSGLVLDKTFYPGDSLGSFEIVNKSKIDSQMRMKIRYTVNFATKEDFICNNTNIQPLLFVFNEDFRYNTKDQYFYYDATPTSDKNDVTLVNYVIPKVIDKEKIINVFSNLVLNGNVVDNKFKNTTIDMQIMFEIKQVAHLSWQKCNDIDFSVGVNK